MIDEVNCAIACETEMLLKLMTHPRALYFLDSATNYIDARFQGRQYALPFSPVPFLIQHACTLLAGVALYEARDINTSNEDSSLNMLTYRQQANSLLEDLVSGAIKLNTYMSAPEVVKNVSSTGAGAGVNNADSCLSKMDVFNFYGRLAGSGVTGVNVCQIIREQQKQSCRNNTD